MKLSSTELARLKQAHPDLIKLVMRAAELTKQPFRVMETLRTEAQQRENIRKKVSWTMRSRHLPGRGGLAYATDLVMIVNGQPSWSWAPYFPFAKFMFGVAKGIGVPIEWGGNWKRFYTAKLGNPADGPHWQLPWREYPR